VARTKVNGAKRPLQTPRHRLDFTPVSTDDSPMDLDDLFAKRPGDPLALLVKQDLDPLSVDELHERKAVLAAEIERIERKIDGVVNFRASADALFKK